MRILFKKQSKKQTRRQAESAFGSEYALHTIASIRAQVYQWLESEQYKLTPPHAQDLSIDYGTALPISMNSSLFTKPDNPIIIVSSPADRNPTSLEEVVLTRVAKEKDLTPVITSMTLSDVISETHDVPKERRMALFVAGFFHKMPPTPQTQMSVKPANGLVLQ